MPHVLLEYSANVPGSFDPRRVLLDVHEVLMSTGLFTLGDVKGRAVRQEVFAVGDGGAARSFVALRISILEGRTEESKARIAEGALAVLRRSFSEAVAQGGCSLSVEVADLHRASYRRVRAGEA